MTDPELELVAARSWKDNNRDIDAEIGDLQTVSNVDVRERSPADQLIGIEKKQVDLELVGPFGICQTKIDAQLLMLERERCGSKMGENTDQTLFSCRTVFNDAIADQERLDAWSMNAGDGFHQWHRAGQDEGVGLPLVRPSSAGR